MAESLAPTSAFTNSISPSTKKLGVLLGMIDVVMLAEEHPEVFCITEKLHRLREARKAYDVACAAYLDARMAVR